MIYELFKDEISLTRDIAEDFFKETQLPGEFKFEYFVSRWKQVLDSGLGVMFGYIPNKAANIEGFMGGVIGNCMLTSDLEAIEALWYIAPKHRGNGAAIRMLKNFEQWAKERGAVRVKMIHLATLNPKAVAKLYDRMGYAKLETAYSKELCQSQPSQQ